MISKELEKKIAQDNQLKSLVNSIRLDFEKKNQDREKAISETLQVINNNIQIIEEYLDNHFKCNPGPLSDCRQLNLGYENAITYTNGRFYLGIKRCAHWKFENKNENLKKSFTYVDYAIDDFSETIEEYWKQLEKDTDIFTGQEIQQRKDFLVRALKLIEKKSPKGYYLYGEPGVGKTTLLKVLANTIAAKQSLSVAFINMPNLVNISKQSLSEKSMNRQRDLVERLKYADVLFLDDIGAESVSVWSRDDLLLFLLTYRMDQKKITFFSSSFSMVQLQQNYLLKKEQYPIEKIKQKRFLERIRALAIEFNLKGESHRL